MGKKKQKQQSQPQIAAEKTVADFQGELIQILATRLETLPKTNESELDTEVTQLKGLQAQVLAENATLTYLSQLAEQIKDAPFMDGQVELQEKLREISSNLNSLIASTNAAGVSGKDSEEQQYNAQLSDDEIEIIHSSNTQWTSNSGGKFVATTSTGSTEESYLHSYDGASSSTTVPTDSATILVAADENLVPIPVRPTRLLVADYAMSIVKQGIFAAFMAMLADPAKERWAETLSDEKIIGPMFSAFGGILAAECFTTARFNNKVALAVQDAAAGILQGDTTINSNRQLTLKRIAKGLDVGLADTYRNYGNPEERARYRRLVALHKQMSFENTMRIIEATIANLTVGYLTEQSIYREQTSDTVDIRFAFLGALLAGLIGKIGSMVIQFRLPRTDPDRGKVASFQNILSIFLPALLLTVTSGFLFSLGIDNQDNSDASAADVVFNGLYNAAFVILVLTMGFTTYDFAKHMRTAKINEQRLATTVTTGEDILSLEGSETTGLLTRPKTTSRMPSIFSNCFGKGDSSRPRSFSAMSVESTGSTTAASTLPAGSVQLGTGGSGGYGTATSTTEVASKKSNRVSQFFVNGGQRVAASLKQAFARGYHRIPESGEAYTIINSVDDDSLSNNSRQLDNNDDNLSNNLGQFANNELKG